MWSPVEIHLCCFLYLMIITKADMNIHVQIFEHMSLFLLGMCIEVHVQSHTYIELHKSLPMWFPKVAALVYVPIAVEGLSMCSTSPPTLLSCHHIQNHYIAVKIFNGTLQIIKAKRLVVLILKAGQKAEVKAYFSRCNSLADAFLKWLTERNQPFSISPKTHGCPPCLRLIKPDADAPNSQCLSNEWLANCESSLTFQNKLLVNQTWVQFLSVPWT